MSYSRKRLLEALEVIRTDIQSIKLKQENFRESNIYRDEIGLRQRRRRDRPILIQAYRDDELSKDDSDYDPDAYRHRQHKQTASSLKSKRKRSLKSRKNATSKASTKQLRTTTTGESDLCLSKGIVQPGEASQDNHSDADPEGELTEKQKVEVACGNTSSLIADWRASFQDLPGQAVHKYLAERNMTRTTRLTDPVPSSGWMELAEVETEFLNSSETRTVSLQQQRRSYQRKRRRTSESETRASEVALKTHKRKRVMGQEGKTGSRDSAIHSEAFSKNAIIHESCFRKTAPEGMDVSTNSTTLKSHMQKSGQCPDKVTSNSVNLTEFRHYRDSASTEYAQSLDARSALRSVHDGGSASRTSSRYGFVKTITTSFAHPIELKSSVKPCDFCPSNCHPCFGVRGHGSARQIDVLIYPDAPCAFNELGFGHAQDFRPTRMCPSCAMNWIMMECCNSGSKSRTINAEERQRFNTFQEQSHDIRPLQVPSHNNRSHVNTFDSSHITDPDNMRSRTLTLPLSTAHTTSHSTRVHLGEICTICASPAHYHCQRPQRYTKTLKPCRLPGIPDSVVISELTAGGVTPSIKLAEPIIGCGLLLCEGCAKVVEICEGKVNKDVLRDAVGRAGRLMRADFAELSGKTGLIWRTYISSTRR